MNAIIELRRMFRLPDYVARIGLPDMDTYERFSPISLARCSA
jgi:hypothetical protein